MMNRLAVAFTGPSGSGKTTLIEKISLALRDSHKVAIIKHDPKDKANFDVIGKDSFRFFDSGAETIVVSPTRTTYFSHESRELERLIDLIKDFDLLMVEGLKNWDLPRVAIFRGEIDLEYIPYSNAIAIDKSVDITKYELPQTLKILDLNDIKSIKEWIFKNAKKV